MKKKPRVGLLPLYLKLYDDCMPERRAEFEPFLNTVVQRLEAQGIEVIRAPVSRIESEFCEAVRSFEEKNADAIITLHLAYSPSLESIRALAETMLPIIILDTTMDADFGPATPPGRIMYNHGIHGVMDMANLLIRKKKRFQIVAGHISDARVISETADYVRAAKAANCLRQTKALRIGPSFHGMGDFAVDEEVLRNALGVSVEQVQPDDLTPYAENVGREELEAEKADDRARFDCDLPEDVHAYSLRVGLGLRKMLDGKGCNAFSMNFLAFQNSTGPVCTVPFLEASKAMARGIGYAGEGDVLTASLGAALAQAFDTPVTFTEIFCPDWKGGTLFLSHMGEINPEVAADKPLMIEKPFPYAPALNPAVLACGIKSGEAVFINIAPGPDESFDILIRPVTVMEDTQDEEMKRSVRGWIKPRGSVADFLEDYSRHGATHHSLLMLGDHVKALSAFREFVGDRVSK